MHGTGWDDSELVAAVEAYRGMLYLHSLGKPFVKKAIYRALAEQFGRSPGAFEYRMQNISAVLDEDGKLWLPGLRPAKNVGELVKARIRKVLLNVEGVCQPHPSSVRPTGSVVCPLGVNEKTGGRVAK